MKRLIFLCDSYPNKKGEFFVEDEMLYHEKQFDKISIISLNNGEVEIERNPPKKSEVFHLSPDFKWKAYIRELPEVLKNASILLKELRFIKKRTDIKLGWSILKIAIKDLFKALILRRRIIEVIGKDLLNSNEQIILYSYWSNFMATALAFIRKEFSIDSIARCHRWDVYFYAHKTPYLPFKLFTFNNLNYTYCISNDAKHYISEKFQKVFDDKIKVSKLGKINKSKPLLLKETKDYKIVSCSTIIPVKRLDKIINVIHYISQNSDISIKWVHFGDGILRKDIDYQVEKLKINAEMKGIVPNEEILKYYKQNFVDLFINLSDSEGIPVSIMEAQSAGIPVLATNVGGTDEIVNDNNGFIVNPEQDLEQIGRRVLQYFDTSKEKVREKRRLSYQSWKNNYDAEKNYSEFVKELRHL